MVAEQKLVDLLHQSSNLGFVQPIVDEHHGQICAMSRLHDGDISGRRDSPRSANCRAESWLVGEGRLSEWCGSPEHGETDPVTGALARFQGQRRRPTSSGLPPGVEGDIEQTPRRGPASVRLALGLGSSSMILRAMMGCAVA